MSVDLSTETNARRIARLYDRRRRQIIMEAGPDHPEFGLSFMRYYLPHYCREDGGWVEPADWHAAFDETLFGTAGSGEWHVHLAPRGFAKSTKASLATPLAVLGLSGLAMGGLLPYVFKPRNYLWVIQDTASQAKQSMEAILAETEDNPRIRADFPHLTPKMGKHNRPIADRDDDVVFASGARLQSLGANQKLRGRRNRQYRPDLCIIDDLENDELVLTKYQRDKLDNWLSSALGFALAKGADLHMLGTLLHHDAVLARVMKRGGWMSHRYDAFAPETETCPDHGYRVDPDDESDPECDLCFGVGEVQRSTWAYRDHHWHAGLRKKAGRRAYNREIRHVVIAEEDKLFPASGFRYTTVTQEQVEEQEWRVRIGVDPATTEKARNDPSAIVVVGKRRGSKDKTVLDAWGGRVRGTKLKAQVIAMWERWGGIVVFESTQAQVWGAEAIEDAGIPVKPTKPAVDKLTRAEPVALDYEQQRYWHNEHLRGSEFETVLDEFPDGEHEDYVDALAHADRELMHEHGMGSAVTVSYGRDKEEEDFYDPRYG